MIGWWTKMLASAMAFMLANVTIFLIHSLATICFAFDWKITPFFWLIWLAGLIYNVTVPPLLWRSRLSVQ
jgi:hypothetical protein